MQLKALGLAHWWLAPAQANGLALLSTCLVIRPNIYLFIFEGSGLGSVVGKWSWLEAAMQSRKKKGGSWEMGGTLVSNFVFYSPGGSQIG